MEQKLDSLYSLLSSSGNTLLDATPTKSPRLPLNPSTNQQHYCPVFESDTLPPYNLTPSRSDNLKFAQQFPFFSFPIPVFDDVPDVISKRIISFKMAEESIQLFKSKTTAFPFVIVSPQTSLAFLRRERPFLLLTILTFAAGEDPKLQRSLEIEIRESLSKRVIVNAEKSIDVLQGLLVYLAW
jgi:hypothetical protein